VSTIRDFDFDELVLHLHRDLQFAFERARTEAASYPLQLDVVKARLGRQLTGSHAGSEPLTENLLNRERYPDEEDWEIEVSYRPGSTAGKKGDGATVPACEKGVTLLTLLEDAPLDHLKGVDRHWKSILEEAGILTLGRLAYYPNEKMLNLCNQNNSLMPLMFQTQALLLARENVPVVPSVFRHKLLIDLLQNPAGVLKDQFGGRLSGPVISDLKQVAAILFLVIDKKIAQKFTLGLFMPGTE